MINNLRLGIRTSRGRRILRERKRAANGNQKENKMMEAKEC
jgi:hypothetical protein